MSALAAWRLKREFRRRGPWISQFEIDGRTYGGELRYDGDPRVRQFFDAFPSALRILEPGCLEGAMTVQLAAKPGSHVTAIDSREENLERGRFVQALFGRDNITFLRADLEEEPLASFGQFDAIFCSGLLYHLSRPWTFLDGLRAASPCVFLWTHYAHGDEIRDERGGYRGFLYREKGLADPRSGMTPESFFMRLPDIVGRLEGAGYHRVEVIDDRPAHQPHACVTLVAEAAN